MSKCEKCGAYPFFPGSAAPEECPFCAAEDDGPVASEEDMQSMIAETKALIERLDAEREQRARAKRFASWLRENVTVAPRRKEGV